MKKISILSVLVTSACLLSGAAYAASSNQLGLGMMSGQFSTNKALLTCGGTLIDTAFNNQMPSYETISNDLIGQICEINYNGIDAKGANSTVKLATFTLGKDSNSNVTAENYKFQVADGAKIGDFTHLVCPTGSASCKYVPITLRFIQTQNQNGNNVVIVKDSSSPFTS